MNSNKKTSIQWNQELYHYGVPRRSGRYKWGSGENPYHHGSDRASKRLQKKAEKAELDGRRKKMAADYRRDINRIKNEYNTANSKLEKEAFANGGYTTAQVIEKTMNEQRRLQQVNDAQIKLHNTGKQIYVDAGRRKAEKSGAKLEKTLRRKGSDPDLATKAGKAKVEKILAKREMRFVTLSPDSAAEESAPLNRYVIRGQKVITSKNVQVLQDSVNRYNKADKNYKRYTRLAKESRRRGK